jgi:hypothetical protein
LDLRPQEAQAWKRPQELICAIPFAMIVKELDRAVWDPERTRAQLKVAQPQWRRGEEAGPNMAVLYSLNCSEL